MSSEQVWDEGPCKICRRHLQVMGGLRICTTHSVAELERAFVKYTVTARNDWDAALQAKFGDIGSVHHLTDLEVVDAIMEFGRAEITLDANIPDCRHLNFQNDYD